MPDDRVADIIFVHGLDGDAFKTWRKGRNPENYWPKWLVKGLSFP
jgi:hypothetical protein